MHLKQQLLEKYCLDNLNLLTAKIIFFNKNRQSSCLEQMWNLVCEYVPNGEIKSSKYFSKLIILYHPDKLKEYQIGIKACNCENSLQKFAHIIPMLSLVERLESGAHTFKTPAEFEQEYGWNYENVTDDYFVVSEDDDTIDPLFDEENVPDGFTFGTGPQYNENSFIGAVKRKIYGSVQVNFPTHQLEDFEEIEMAEYEIEFLDGVEFCTYAKILDLSYNSIYDISKLEYCNYIQELYLQNNNISVIDALGFLPDLRVLDLAQNQIDDITVLSELKCLEFVNLIGNNVPESDVKALKELGVVVVV